MSADPLPLFVFGTLRRGESNHHYLVGAYLRVEPALLKGFRRGLARHGFPAAVPSPGDELDGELFVLDPVRYDHVLVAIDLLEDLPPGELKGPYYDRAIVEVDVPSGRRRAWAYVSPRPEQTRRSK